MPSPSFRPSQPRPSQTSRPAPQPLPRTLPSVVQPGKVNSSVPNRPMPVSRKHSPDSNPMPGGKR